MVGIVLVSHSEKIAMGAQELIEQMTKGSVPLEVAGGTSDARLGTDVNLIMEKIEKVYSPSGVLVIVDLGSAVMSAQMAIESMEEEKRKNVIIADAPFLEGAISAVMESSFGKGLEEVKSAAEAAKNLNKL
ncbi:dihydroxyacetone kinase phosphotransfer subunit [Desulfohalotomaculum tongense]|uniref:dihydroxyacetone kinase phosphoryl donor subunit DhaM n=1 Tax=Desulforadius tongensis TaxID=1216062 RepID=UPI0019580EE5|nr:dihydroxyacetone kinase phosphotransfer subunit [Desulforadius tongensis]